MHHSGVQGQGENLYWSSDDGSFADAVNMWVKEGEKYHGEKIGEGNLADWGHYSELACLVVLGMGLVEELVLLMSCVAAQVMWKQSVQIGMGKAKSKAGGTYIVARYTPQGELASCQCGWCSFDANVCSRQHVRTDTILIDPTSGPIGGMEEVS